MEKSLTAVSYTHLDVYKRQLPVLEQVMRMMSLVAQEKGTELTYRAEGTCTMLATSLGQVSSNSENAQNLAVLHGFIKTSLFPFILTCSYYYA